MRYLADTHILLWAMENHLDNTKMPNKAKEIMLDEKPDSTPSDVLKVVCEKLGMLDAKRSVAVS